MRVLLWMFVAGALQAEPARLETIAAILREGGLPLNLLGVALVESGFDPAARSPKDALGIWQLMPDTARAFGITAAERVDPEKATRAAARYLKRLHTRFGDWPLALAAYNAGEQRVQEAMDRARSRDFARIAPHLPGETRRYVPAVIAAQSRFPQPVDNGNDAATARRARVVYAPFSMAP